jgi:cell division protein FtsI/penicillin-binding protein 2
MAIGLRMQVTPLQMALASAAVGQGAWSRRMLLALGRQDSVTPARRRWAYAWTASRPA